ncbi:MAG: S1 RNA-binding domain-containing protein [Spirochaetia bacterium]|nr:S1 RNA-binding domain-containing protein [Spirochaetia bacterium]
MLRDGMIVKGKVLRKQDGDIFVDLQYKSEGLIPKDETMKYTYYDELKPGDEVDVHIKRVETAEGFVILSKIIADKKIIFGKVKNAFKDGGFLDGRVIKSVKGGFIIDFGANVTAFLPMSHSKSYGEDIAGKTLPLKVIQLDEEKRNVVVSYKEYMTQKEKTEADALSTAFPVNEKAVVKVMQVLPDGIEVEKSGVKSFIPLSELSWSSVTDVAREGINEGMDLEVMVVSNEKGRIILSPKRLKDNPFKSFMDQNKPGDRLGVKVKEILPEGMTVSIPGGLDGFIPSGELSYFKRIKSASDIYKPGDELKACIIKIDEIKNRVILSVKRLEKNPWSIMEERYPVGARVFGTVKTLKEGEGAEIELEENIDAFIQPADIAWTPFASLSEVLKPGERKEFKIIGVDKNAYCIQLGLKQLTISPWVTVASRYKEGDYIDGRIMDFDDSGAIIDAGEGVTGRVAIKDRSKLIHKKGETIKVKILKIDSDAKKLFLASKDLEQSEEQKQIDEYMKTHEPESGFKLNDVFNFGGVNPVGKDAK